MIQEYSLSLVLAHLCDHLGPGLSNRGGGLQRFVVALLAEHVVQQTSYKWRHCYLIIIYSLKSYSLITFDTLSSIFLNICIVCFLNPRSGFCNPLLNIGPFQVTLRQNFIYAMDEIRYISSSLNIHTAIMWIWRSAAVVTVVTVYIYPLLGINLSHFIPKMVKQLRRQ